jgi:hypothetical protein
VGKGPIVVELPPVRHADGVIAVRKVAPECPRGFERRRAPCSSRGAHALLGGVPGLVRQFRAIGGTTLVALFLIVLGELEVNACSVSQVTTPVVPKQCEDLLFEGAGRCLGKTGDIKRWVRLARRGL